MKRNYKRLLVISDLHCGHAVGLTPPDYQYPVVEGTHRGAFGVMQKTMWDWYVKTLDKLRPIDFLVVNGDAVDGTGHRSGGTEQITVDRNEQVDMASQCIKLANAKKILLTHGTGYHTGDAEDWETNLHLAVKADKIGSHEWIDIRGNIFDFKHHIGNSSVPHGRFTAVAKEKLWNDQWYLKDGAQPNSDYIIRSHVHEYRCVETSRFSAMTTPSLQGFGSKFGSRRCSGTIDIGMVYFDIKDNGEVSQCLQQLKSDVLKADILKW